MPQEYNQYTITSGPGKFDLMLAVFGEKDSLTFGLSGLSGHQRISMDIKIRGIIRESGTSGWIVLGVLGNDQVKLMYWTNRERRQSSLGFLTFENWS
jgi:hypothetical protein